MSSPARLDQGRAKDDSASSSSAPEPEEHKEQSTSSMMALPGLALGRLTVAGEPLPLTQVKQELLELAPNLASVLEKGELDLILTYLEGRNYNCTLLSQLYGAAMNLHKEFAQFSTDASNPQTWAVLHRLRGGQAKRGFADFLRAKAVRPMNAETVKEGRAEWGKANAKYEPDNFGGGHTWPRNAVWLQRVLGRRVILTDVPLRRSNLMCKIDDDGKPVSGYDRGKHEGAPSAYAREIAGLLNDGYVGLWGHELTPTFDQLAIPAEDRAVPVQTFVMVPDPIKHAGKGAVIPPQLYEVLDRRRHVDHKFLKAIVTGAKVPPEDFGDLITALELAGMPVLNPTEPATLAARVVDAKQRQALADEHQRRSEQGKLTSTKGQEREESQQRGLDKRAAMAAASSEILAEGMDLALMQSWLVRRLTEMGRTKKSFNPTGEQCKTLLAEGRGQGWFGDDFSAASLKRHIKDKVAALLKDKPSPLGDEAASPLGD